MSGTPFLGELRIFSFVYAPKGWAQCNGQVLPINQNQALFSLLGTMYGGNGQTTFALPNMQGRIPIHVGNGHTQGETAGSTSVTLNIQQLPTHLHLLTGSTKSDRDTPNPNTTDPTNALFADTQAKIYAPPQGNLTTLAPAVISNVGGSQPHTNEQPYLTLNFCIALQGIFPSRS
ncbi:MAG TPA: tail fiber protein [Actinomycetota bacterium]